MKTLKTLKIGGLINVSNMVLYHEEDGYIVPWNPQNTVGNSNVKFIATIVSDEYEIDVCEWAEAAPARATMIKVLTQFGIGYVSPRRIKTRDIL